MSTLAKQRTIALSSFHDELLDRLDGKAAEANERSEQGFSCVKMLLRRITNADGSVSCAAIECLMEVCRVMPHVHAPLVEDSTCPSLYNNVDQEGGAREVGDWMALRGVSILEHTAKRAMSDGRQRLLELGEATTSWISMYCLRRELMKIGAGPEWDILARVRDHAEAVAWENRSRVFLMALRSICTNERGELRVEGFDPLDSALLHVALGVDVDLEYRSRWRDLFAQSVSQPVVRGGLLVFKEALLAFLRTFAGPPGNEADFVSFVREFKERERQFFKGLLGE